MKSDWLDVVVSNRWEEAKDIHCFELKSSAGSPLPQVEAGAHVAIQLTPEIVRHYSLCQPYLSGSYLLAVLREANSRGGSRKMVEEVCVGHTLKISQPSNNFGLDPSATHSILIAGGIGITPIIAMAESLAAAKASFELHYAVRSQQHLAFSSRLPDLAEANDVDVLMEDTGGRLNLKEILTGPREGCHIYVCGPVGLIDAVLDAAAQHGWPHSQVHREFFSAETKSNTLNSEFQVVASRSKKTVTVMPEKSISSALLDAGISIPVFCEQGVCGSCVTPVLEGHPDHRDSFLSADAHAQNREMTVCCSRSLSPVLVLDI